MYSMHPFLFTVMFQASSQRGHRIPQLYLPRRRGRGRSRRGRRRSGLALETENCSPGGRVGVRRARGAGGSRGRGHHHVGALPDETAAAAHKLRVLSLRGRGGRGSCRRSSPRSRGPSPASAALFGADSGGRQVLLRRGGICRGSAAPALQRASLHQGCAGTVSLLTFKAR